LDRAGDLLGRGANFLARGGHLLGGGRDVGREPVELGDGPLDLVEHLVEVLADLLHLLVVAFGVRAGSEVAVGGSTHDRTVLGGFFLQVTVDLLDALAFAFGLLAGGFGFLNLLAQRDAHRVETIVEPADVVDPLGLEVHVEIPLLHLTGLVGESVDRDGGVPTEDRTDHADQEDADDGRVDPPRVDRVHEPERLSGGFVAYDDPISPEHARGTGDVIAVTVESVRVLAEGQRRTRDSHRRRVLGPRRLQEVGATAVAHAERRVVAIASVPVALIRAVVDFRAVADVVEHDLVVTVDDHRRDALLVLKLVGVRLEVGGVDDCSVLVRGGALDVGDDGGVLSELALGDVGVRDPRDRRGRLRVGFARNVVEFAGRHVAVGLVGARRHCLVGDVDVGDIERVGV